MHASTCSCINIIVVINVRAAALPFNSMVRCVVGREREVVNAKFLIGHHFVYLSIQREEV